MNERKRPQSNSGEKIHLPAFPIAGNKLFERIGTAVSASRGYSLENMQFAKLMGRSESTTSHWFGVSPQPHLVSLFCLLEQVPPPDRYRVVDSLCRELPIFEHPRLRHNQVALSRLRNLLAQSTGLTLVVGGTDDQRTFIVTALGHAFCRIDRLHRTPTGIDLHQPDWFVPVETVSYFKGFADPLHSAGVVGQVWPEIVGTTKPLVLLNGVWSAFPNLRDDILSLAKKRHVVLADQQISAPKRDLGPEHPLHILTVSSARENANWISVQVTRAH